ncbi:TPA: DUF4234 domain-containing protein [Citrobacter freundii]|uniref:DUF4234 domain-containing protein n=1 Tax=Salmonella enterica TaxID=28901 RepID=A0A750IGN6_SALER|nr:MULTISPECIES: DUF4234 domain-containing protein [Enterobacteriaceae]EBC5763288.1 DUF4234 domain-containing protein [Salmonella enterica subsp. enterica]KDF13378.1 hypothetical protein AF42_03480 [Citrobacter freundii MGH 56]AUT95585.1 DUF4234 domain-containing protein [Citrobacter freundii]EAA7968555.1 DUF4234 domain-containing protein [Salmonella enterica]EAM6480628.1 DUF4234 domain-containing protein [Salmonella enterica]
MTDITTLSQRLNTRTLHFVLLTLVTCGVWPLLWLYKKQDIISDTTGYPVYGKLFIIWLAVCYGLGHQLATAVSSDVYGYDPTSDTLLTLSGLLSLACGVMYVVWAFKARTALRHYTLNTFRFDLKMNAFYTVIFNIFYITYCVNDMQQALAKHQIIHGNTAPATPTASDAITTQSPQ